MTRWHDAFPNVPAADAEPGVVDLFEQRMSLIRLARLLHQAEQALKLEHKLISRVTIGRTR